MNKKISIEILKENHPKIFCYLNKFLRYFPLIYIICVAFLFLPLPVDIYNPFTNYDVQVKVLFEQTTGPSLYVTDYISDKTIKEVLDKKGVDTSNLKAGIELSDYNVLFSKADWHYIPGFLEERPHPILYADVVGTKYDKAMGGDVPVLDVKYVNYFLPVFYNNHFLFIVYFIVIGAPILCIDLIIIFIRLFFKLRNM